MSLTSMSGSLIQVVSSSTFETMAWCLVGLLMIGQIFASSSELEWPIAHASHEVVDWAVTHCRAIHGCDSSSTVEWSKRVHTCQVEVVMCGGLYGCVWVCVGVYHGDMVYPEMGGETMSWLLMVGLTMDSFAFSPLQLATSWSMSCLRQARLPSGPR